MGVTPIRGEDDPDDPGAAAGAPGAAGAAGAEPEPDPGPTAEEEEAAAAAAEEEESQQVLDFGDKLTLQMKGKKPTRSQVKIRSVSRDISGQIEEDDQSYAFVVVGHLSNLEFPISRDGAGRVTGKIRRHEIDPEDVLKIPSSVYDEVMDLIESASAVEEAKAA